MGYPHEGSPAAPGSQSSCLASIMPKSVLGTSGGSDGGSSSKPKTSTASKHSLWTHCCEHNDRACFCLSDASPHPRHPTGLTTPPQPYQKPPMESIPHCWDRNDSKTERCRSLRQNDDHHLLREHPHPPPFSNEGLEYHSHKSAPACPHVPFVDGLV